ncbi:DciA family protein [Streptomyces sp. NPDC058084]|uniref:DciA family protein n=1 Tax=Streptomyces sp. NPDC058084 TaxID=3346333 RepID=UPI0036E4E640
MSAEETPSSGADLARIALRQAKESARRKGTTTAKPRRSVRHARGDGRDPLALGSVMQRWLVDNGWQEAADGGTLINRWPAIIGEERAAHWKAVRFDEATKTLTVLCESDSWARMLSLVSRQIVADVNQAMKGTPLQAIQVRKGVHRGAPPVPAAVADPSPAPATRSHPAGAAPSSRYLEVRDRLRTAKADRDAAVEPRTRLIADRIQADPNDHAEARYLLDDLEQQTARAADVERRALLRSRQERHHPKTASPALNRATGAA